MGEKAVDHKMAFDSCGKYIVSSFYYATEEVSPSLFIHLSM